MSGHRLFCPTCGAQRTGPVCTNCGYDFVADEATPAITLRRGINPVSLVVGILVVVVVGYLLVSSILATT